MRKVEIGEAVMKCQREVACAFGMFEARTGHEVTGVELIYMNDDEIGVKILHQPLAAVASQAKPKKKSA